MRDLRARANMKIIVAADKKIQDTIAKVSTPHFSVARKRNLFNILARDMLILESSKKASIAVINKAGEVIPESKLLVLNIDDPALKKIKKENGAKIMTFGFGENADFQASDIQDTSFKLNYKGSIVPVWTNNKEDIYSVLAAACVGTYLGLNLVQISEALKK